MRKTALIGLLLCTLIQLSFAGGEIPPRAGLYDPVTHRSTTTGDLYPTFPEDANQIPPMNPDRVDDIDQALTILIRTPDIGNTFEPTNFDSMLYSSGIYPTGSMNDYFLESSYGIFGVDGEVVGWVMAENNYNYYTWNNNGLGYYPHNAQKLVEEAVLGADAMGVDFSQYDNDGDGWVDALIVVHQGPGAENTGSDDDIWSHRWAMHDPIELDGVMVYDYSMDPELSGTGTTGEIEHIGVFAHEYTHLLGLPDLYDYDAKLDSMTHITPNDANDHPVMDWGLMGYGGYGLSSYGRGTYPNHHNAYFKYLLGWLEPITLGLSQTGIEVPSYETNPVAYKIPISGSQTEFFLICNVDPTNPNANFDKYDSDFSAWYSWFTPGSNPLDAGLVITHVDQEMPLNNGWPDDPHYGCAIVDAGYTPSQPWPGLEFTEWWYPHEFRIGAAFSAEDEQDELTPLTDPSSDGYYGPSGIYITNISNSGPLMTFDLEFIGGSPEFEYSGYIVENDGRDEDGFLDMTETGDLYILLRNGGNGEAIDVSATLSTSDPYITIVQGIADYSDLGISFSGYNETPFVLTIDDNCPPAYDADITLDISWTGGSESISFPLELCWDIALEDDFEYGSVGWTHGIAFGSYFDQWHESTQRNHTVDGDYSWKCGSEGNGGYGALLNAELVTPMWQAVGEARLSFWHRMNCEEHWDGGLIERNSGSGWVQVTPVGGYPDQITHTSAGGPFSYGTPVFSSDFDWMKTTVTLTDCNNEEEFIRFRFGSDQGTSEEGWYIDDVKLYYGDGLIGVQEELLKELPWTFDLKSPHPNPFNASARFEFTLPSRSDVSLKLIDVQGRLVSTLVDGNKAAGEHLVTIDGTGLPSGMYFIVLDTPDRTAVQKILHIK